MKLQPNFAQSDHRGKFIEVWRGDNWREMNFFTINAGHTRGAHYHKETRELFFLVEGELEIRLVDIRTGSESVFRCGEGEIVTIDPYQLHYLNALRESKVISCLSLPFDEKNPDMFPAPPSNP